MKSKIAFHNVDNSLALKEFIKKKTQVLKKLLWSGESADWIIQKESKLFIPSIKLKLRDKTITVHSRADNAYKAVSLAFEKARRSVISDHRKHKLH